MVPRRRIFWVDSLPLFSPGILVEFSPGCMAPTILPLNHWPLTNTVWRNYSIQGLNVGKASGPENLPCRLLRELAHELTPILTCIHKQSIETSTLPSVWTKAFVAPVFKKSARCMLENYRPVSLTCVSSKILEHIICKHFRTHLEQYENLTPLNHHFRAKFSCEIQLLLTLQDLLLAKDRKLQTDVAILDFSKAFDTVPHDRLLGKMQFVGIQDKQSIETSTLPSVWTKAFVAPVFKKSTNCMLENYRLVSLTCVSCKILEHIICKHFRTHLEQYGNLTQLNHGFRTKFSCETQLLLTLQDLLLARDRKIQTDVAILDFSKAFDTVPHDRLLGKMQFVGIQDPLLDWSAAFLKTQEQTVVVDGRIFSHVKSYQECPKALF